MATPQGNLNQTAASGQEFVGFSQVEITAEEKGPALPDPAIHAIPVPSARIQELLAPLNLSDAVKASFAAVLEGRPGAFLVVSVYPIPKGDEVNRRKARNVYGASSGVDLPIADNENNRLKFTSLLFAPTKKDEDGGSSDAAEKDLEEK